MVPLGIDDNGQTYYFEYLNDKGELVEECCGAYNNGYLSYIEYRLCEPEIDCPIYKDQILSQNCKDRFSHGYCDKCKYQDLKNYKIQKMIELDIIDRRGNLNSDFKDFIQIDNSEGDSK